MSAAAIDAAYFMNLDPGQSVLVNVSGPNVRRRLKSWRVPEVVSIKMYCGPGPFVVSVPDIDRVLHEFKECEYKETLKKRFAHCSRILKMSEVEIRGALSQNVWDAFTPFQMQVFYVARRILMEADCIGAPLS